MWYMPTIVEIKGLPILGWMDSMSTKEEERFDPGVRLRGSPEDDALFDWVGGQG